MCEVCLYSLSSSYFLLSTFSLSYFYLSHKLFTYAANQLPVANQLSLAKQSSVANQLYIANQLFHIYAHKYLNSYYSLFLISTTCLVEFASQHDLCKATIVYEEEYHDKGHDNLMQDFCAKTFMMEIQNINQRT